MYKKEYMQPSTEVVMIQQQRHVLTTSLIEKVSTEGLGDDGIKLPDGSDDITGSIIDAI